MQNAARAVEVIGVFDETIVCYDYVIGSAAFTLGPSPQASLNFPSEHRLVWFEEGQACYSDASGVHTLDSGKRVRIELNGLQFYLAEMSAPAAEALRKRIDWTAPAYGLAVATGTAAFALATTMIPADPQSLALDPFGEISRTVSVQIAPLLETQKKAHGGGEGKDGARENRAYRDAAGKMGAKDTPDTHKRYAIMKRPNQTKETVAQRRQSANDAAASSALISMVSTGSWVGAINGPQDPFGADARDALGGLIGTEIGASGGYQGLDEHGLGPGGGGQNENTIGLTSSCRPGDKRCTGTLAYGPIGGHRSRTPGWKDPKWVPKTEQKIDAVKPGEATVVGWDREIIRRVVHRHLNEVKFCYERELLRDNSLGGRVVVKFVVSTLGRVLTSSIERSTVASDRVNSCVADAVRRWQFPVPEGVTQPASVSYPFVLQAAGQATASR